MESRDSARIAKSDALVKLAPQPLKHVGHELAHDDFHSRHARKARYLDKGPFFKAQHLRSHLPCRVRPRKRGDEDADQNAQHSVNPPAEIRADKTYGYAYQRAE